MMKHLAIGIGCWAMSAATWAAGGPQIRLEVCGDKTLRSACNYGGDAA